MAWRIHEKVTHGEIDNRHPGVVEGRIWMAGSEEPILLHLKGNCWSDLAGCFFSFRNPAAREDLLLNLAPVQDGVVGDMTASRKVRVPTVTSEELQELIRTNQPIPTQLGNALYLEWFSEANGRVVLEAAHYQFEISPPEWRMTPEQEEEQRRQNQENLQEFLQNLVNQQSYLEITEGEEDEAEPLDEFEWERLLRKSDQITDEYLAALEKFRDDPDCDRRVAEAMGWDWLLEEGDLPEENPLYDFVKEATGSDILHGVEDEAFLEEEDEQDEDEEEDEEMFDDEDEGHPLAIRARELACHLFQMTEERGLLKSQDATLLSLLTCSNATAAKLAGALSAISPDGDTDYGFVIATLKRSLTPLHQAIAAADRVADRVPEESHWLLDARDELFQVRQEVLALMKFFRDELNGHQ
jgi:hypothetical protein